MATYTLAAGRQRKYTFIAIALAHAPRIKLWQIDDSFGDVCHTGHRCTTHFAVDNHAISIAGAGAAWEDFPRGVPGFANMILLLRGYGVV